MDPLDRLARQQRLKKVAVVTGQFLIVLLVCVLLFIGANEILGWITGSQLGMVDA